MRISLGLRCSVCSREIDRLALCETIVWDVERLYEEALSRDISDVEVAAMHEALQHFPATDNRKAECLTILGDICFSVNVERTTCLYEDAVAVAEQNKETIPAERADILLLQALLRLRDAYRERFEQGGNMEDMHKAIETAHKALGLVPRGDSEHIDQLDVLVRCLLGCYYRVGNSAYLNSAVEYAEQAVVLTPEGHPAYAGRLNSLSTSLQRRFLRLGDLSDLSSAMDNAQKALALTPEDHPEYAAQLHIIGDILQYRFTRLGDLSDINSAVGNGQKAVHLTPEDHPEYAERLSSLSASLQNRFVKLGDLSDLSSAIDNEQKALDFTPEGHLNYAVRLHALGDLLHFRFTRLGDLSDINSAVENGQKAVHLTPEGHPAYALRLNVLSASLQSRFLRLDNLSDLSSAIDNIQKGLALTPADHPEYAVHLHLLSDLLQFRFTRLGDLSDINSAVENGQKALCLTPEDHPEYAGQLSSLSTSFQRRFLRLGDLSDLSSAMDNAQKAVDLTPAENPEYAAQLHILGDILQFRFSRLGDLSDINSAIDNGQKAVSLTPQGHPEYGLRLSVLSASLQIRFLQLGDLSDLTAAIDNGQRSLALMPDGHPDQSIQCLNLANAFRLRFIHQHNSSDISSSLYHYQAAAQSISGSIDTKFVAASAWQIVALQYSSTDEMKHASTVALDLIPQLIWIGSSIQDRQYALQEVGVVVRHAVSGAIQSKEFQLAIEWLEQGRSVLWNQILESRSPVAELHQQHPTIASEFQSVSYQLEASHSRLISTVQFNADHYHHLATLREELLTNIRQLPGFERFLLPKQFSEIASGTRQGHVVMLNVSIISCDALILRPDSADILHVPLPGMTHHDAMRWENYLESLIIYDAFTIGEMDERLMRNSEVPHASMVTSTLARLEEERDAKRLKGERVPDHGKRLNKEEGLKYLLAKLWHGIVSPVLDALSIKESENISHIWWCPTGPLAVLPIHAAGIYPDGPKLSDLAVSSITPSIATLQRTSDNTGKPQLLTVALPNEAGLPETRTEVESIARHAKGVNVLELMESNATKARVSEVMKHSQWVHFACHGKQHVTKSAESYLALAGHSQLTLTEIIGFNLHNAQLAFLSACETATGDKQLREEAMHLAAGMLLAGYRSVIATMWTINDDIASKIAVETYRLLFNRYNADYRRAGEALHFAVQNVRKDREHKGEKVPLFNWVPFIHLGI